MINISALLAYRGTHYYGFQKTAMGPSIQETIEKALKTVLQHSIKIQAASRTDRGVHARGQVIHFFTDKVLPLPKLKHALNQLLPNDIVILDLKVEQSDFHPSLQAVKKHYRYEIDSTSTQLPFNRDIAWHYYYPLSLDLMKEGAALVEGTHDFSSFSNLSYKNPICNIEKILISSPSQNRIKIDLYGDRFLYKMARNLVGTLAYIGSGKIEIEALPTIFSSKKRALAGVSAPAHGLYLERIFY